jgi:hypothetical protein
MAATMPTLHSDLPETARPIIVKFVAKGHQKDHQGIFLRQFPGQIPNWGRCKFLFDPDAKIYDWLAVYDDMAPMPGERFSTRVESLACAPQHTLFITMEPSSIKTYGYDFLNQFGVVITSQEPWAIPNSQAVYTQPALRWFYGESKQHLRTWDEMTQSPPEYKSGDLSAVCSSKKQKNTVHADRYAFTMRMKELMPEMALFGRGVCPIDDKADALDPYRYHIVIENHQAPHHWTEKLADAFLGLTLPFYFGCPNADEYFDPQSFIPIDVRDPEGAARIIREAIATNQFERRFSAIKEARRRVLNEYNLFAVVAREVEMRFDPTAFLNPHSCVYSRHASRKRSLLHTMRFSVEQIRMSLRSRQIKRRSKAA